MLTTCAVDTDILKPDTGALQIARPMPSGPPSRLASKDNSAGQITPTTPDTDKDGGDARYTEPVSEGEDDEDRDRMAARDEDKRTGLVGHEAQVREAIAWREKMLSQAQKDGRSVSPAKSVKVGETAKAKAPVVAREPSGEDGGADDSDEEDSANGDERTPFLRSRKGRTQSQDMVQKARAMSIDPLAPSTAFDETLRNRLRRETQARASSEDTDETGETAHVGDERVLERNWRAPAGKRIAVPVRIGEDMSVSLLTTC